MSTSRKVSNSSVTIVVPSEWKRCNGFEVVLRLHFDIRRAQATRCIPRFLSHAMMRCFMGPTASVYTGHACQPSVPGDDTSSTK